MRGQAGFWDIDERSGRLSAAGDPLEKLNAVVPWDVFRKPLAKALKRSDGAKGGRPPYDAVLMFKIMVLQALYNLSDEQAEFQIPGPAVLHAVCRARPWRQGAGRQDDLAFPRAPHPSPRGGQPVRPLRQASRQGRLPGDGWADRRYHIVAGPQQRNSEADKADIKAGKVPQKWKGKPAKVRQKDRDARWTIKFSKAKADEQGKTRQRDIAVPAFGYKNHASIDRRHGFIRGWAVTSASAWDGAQLRNVPNKNNTGSTVWADTAYRSKKNEAWLEKNGYFSDIHHKKPKGRPMSERTARANGRRSKIRAFVEYVFAQQKSRMGLFVRTIGIARARIRIGMARGRKGSIKSSTSWKGLSRDR